MHKKLGKSNKLELSDTEYLDWVYGGLHFPDPNDPGYYAEFYEEYNYHPEDVTKKGENNGN